ncbi:MAG: hypothetical protein GY847_40395 [Proteobacteria bacterium]|nr:hypothetical protein [Pseudomonadota bacterium]
MTVDKEKKSQWARSLDEAGLIDEIEDDWALPDELDSNATIRVESQSKIKGEDSSSSEESVPFAVPVSSDVPGPPEKKARSTLSFTSKEPAAVFEEPAGISEEPTAVFEEPAAVFEEPAAVFEEPAAASVVEVCGERISVFPESSETLAAEGAILDEPPSLIDSSPSIHDAIRESRPSAKDDDLFGDDPLALVEEIGERRNHEASMRERFDLGDYTGTLEIAEEILKMEPDNEVVLECAETARNVLIQMYESRIGSLDRVPKLAIDPSEMIWHNLNPETTFIVSRIDGMITFEDILDISGLPRFETFRILNQLLQDGVIK